MEGAAEIIIEMSSAGVQPNEAPSRCTQLSWLRLASARASRVPCSGISSLGSTELCHDIRSQRGDIHTTAQRSGIPSGPVLCFRVCLYCALLNRERGSVICQMTWTSMLTACANAGDDAWGAVVFRRTLQGTGVTARASYVPWMSSDC